MADAEWLTSRDLSRKTGIPESTIRRYITTYGEFFAHRTYGRKTTYPHEAVDLLQRIKELHNDGRVTDEVKAILAQDHTATLTVSTTPPPKNETEDVLKSGEEHEVQLAQLSTIAQQIAGEIPRLTDQIQTASHDFTTRLDQIEQARQADTKKTNLVIIGCFAAFIIVILILFLLR